LQYDYTANFTDREALMARYAADHKAGTHDRILASASRQFRAGGIADVGIAGIMADAGLTNGAFYAHFASKNDLVKEAVVTTLTAQRESMAEEISRDDLATLIRDYLSDHHRDTPEDGCPSAAMLSEIGRASSELKVAYRDSLDPTLALIESRLGGDSTTKHARATAMFSLLVGSMQLARATADATESGAVLEAGIAGAMSLAG
jgi:TetR/AcrR family transcriptional repressor of nem operon